MAHSTGEPEHLNREKGVIFGDKQYAKEELVAELTSATVGQSLGISTHIREENAMYLKNWLGALKEDPKFIYNILADVGKASNMIQEHTARMEQYLTPEERFIQAVLQNNRPVLEQIEKLKILLLHPGYWKVLRQTILQPTTLKRYTALSAFRCLPWKRSQP